MVVAFQFVQLAAFSLPSHPAIQLWLLVDLCLIVHAGLRGRWWWALALTVCPPLWPFYLWIALAGSAEPERRDHDRELDLSERLSHGDEPHLHRELADICFREAKYEEARRHYEAALRDEPGNPDTKAHLAHCLLKLDRPTEARGFFEEICATDPRHDGGGTLTGLAEALTAVGEKARARELWEQLAGESDEIRPRVRLAEILAEAGEKDRARQLVEEVLREETSTARIPRRQDEQWNYRARQLLKTIR